MQKIKTYIRSFLFVFFIFSASLLLAESCSSTGAKQNKYTASGCSYTTQTRTCCSNGSWSAWGGSCPTVIQCSGASYETCNGCGTRTRTCNTSTGKWSAWSACEMPTCEWGGVEGGVYAMTESEIASEFGDYVWISDPHGSCSCSQKNKTGIVNKGTQHGYIMVAGPVYCSCSGF